MTKENAFFCISKAYKPYICDNELSNIFSAPMCYQILRCKRMCMCFCVSFPPVLSSYRSFINSIFVTLSKG